MASSPVRRRIVLGIALGATLASAGWIAAHEGPQVEVVQPAKRATTEAPVRPPEVMIEASELNAVERKARGTAASKVPDLFPPQSWDPPPPPAAVAPPPPPPVAPPLPYVFIGKLVEGDVTTVFLAREDRNFAVKAGDTLEGSYRIDEIKGELMILTYLPLSQKQSIPIGRVN